MSAKDNVVQLQRKSGKISTREVHEYQGNVQDPMFINTAFFKDTNYFTMSTNSNINLSIDITFLNVKLMVISNNHKLIKKITDITGGLDNPEEDNIITVPDIYNHKTQFITMLVEWLTEIITDKELYDDIYDIINTEIYITDIPNENIYYSIVIRFKLHWRPEGNETTYDVENNKVVNSINDIYDIEPLVKLLDGDYTQFNSLFIMDFTNIHSCKGDGFYQETINNIKTFNPIHYSQYSDNIQQCNELIIPHIKSMQERVVGSGLKSFMTYNNMDKVEDVSHILLEYISSTMAISNSVYMTALHMSGAFEEDDKNYIMVTTKSVVYK